MRASVLLIVACVLAASMAVAEPLSSSAGNSTAPVVPLTKPLAPAGVAQCVHVQNDAHFCNAQSLGFTHASLMYSAEEQEQNALSRYESIFSNGNKEYPDQCQVLYQRLVCGKYFYRCDAETGRVHKPCRSMCEDIVSTCQCVEATKQLDCSSEKWSDDATTCTLLPTADTPYVMPGDEAHLRTSGKLVAGQVQPGGFAKYFFTMDGDVSAFTVEVEPEAEDAVVVEQAPVNGTARAAGAAETRAVHDSLDVYIKRGSFATREMNDYTVLAPGVDGKYSEAVLPDDADTGKWYVTVRAEPREGKAVRFNVKVTWGTSVCTVPTVEQVPFCSMVAGNRMSVLDRNIEARDAAARDLYERFERKSISGMCETAMKNYVCTRMFRRCNVHGLPMPVCRATCLDYASSCGFPSNQTVTTGLGGHLDTLYCLDNATYSSYEPCSSVDMSAVEVCPGGCGDHGSCNATARACVCEEGFAGRNCAMTRAAEEQEEDGEKVSHLTIIVVASSFGVVLTVLLAKIYINRRNKRLLRFNTENQGLLYDPQQHQQQQQQQPQGNYARPRADATGPGMVGAAPPAYNPFGRPSIAPEGPSPYSAHTQGNFAPY